MTIVALAKAPLNREPAARVLAQQTGLSLAEARMRAAPEPPTLLARLPDGDARGLVNALRVADQAALAIPEPVRGDGQRTVAHTLAFFPAGVSFTPRTGPPRNLRWEEIAVMLRAASAVSTKTETTERSYSFSAAASGQNLSVEARETTRRTANEQVEQSLLVYARDGRCAVVRESAMSFLCLKERMQLSRAANVVAVGRLLREKAPHAFFDERLVKAGRRPLPVYLVGGGGETTVTQGATATTRSSTASGLDVLAEALFLGVVAGLLP